VVQVLADTTLIPREIALSHAYGEKSGLGRLPGVQSVGAVHLLSLAGGCPATSQRWARCRKVVAPAVDVRLVLVGRSKVPVRSSLQRGHSLVFGKR